MERWNVGTLERWNVGTYNEHMFNYSFWADEAYISGIASQLVAGKYSLFQAFDALSYQRLYILVISLFFKLFGVSEFVARLPSMIAFVIGIGIIFLLAKKMSGVYGGLISAFLYAFSHLNLAYATMARPYSILETIALLILYLLTEKKTNHLLIILLCIIATLLHSIGVMIWGVYFVYLVLRLKSSKVKKLGLSNLQTLKPSNLQTLKPSNYLNLIVFICIGYFLILPIASSSLGGGLFPYNNSYQSVKLFTYKYSFILVSAFFGFIWSFKKNRNLNLAILFYSAVVFFMATFRAYIFNIRYVLSLFGIMFLYFGIFWAKVGEKYENSFKVIRFKGLKVTGKAIVPLSVIILMYVTGYKIVRFPQTYYNPNIDKYGDVQIANYKDFYGELKKRFPDYKNLYVVNDTFDVEYWYFGRYSNTYFMKFTKKPYKHHTANAMIYGSLADFKKIVKKYRRGLLIIEDWQSFVPDDVKEYAKKNLKLEFRVESLKEAPDDPWPLALYSWGMEPKVLKF